MASSPKHIAVIGAGAAGVFAAIHAAQSGAKVEIFEASKKALSKVRISGGGRCNICHHVENVGALMKAYPRQSKALRKAFSQFAYPETRDWFESRGLALKVEGDMRVFPKTDSSESVIQLLMNELQKGKVPIHYGQRLKRIWPVEDGFELDFGNNSLRFDRVILAMGGQPKQSGFDPLSDLKLEIIPPVPSLFTFNLPEHPFKDLPGLSVPLGSVQVPGTKWRQEGPVLITHWGLSAYAVLKLSAWQARDLAERDYQFPIMVNWLAAADHDFEQFIAEQIQEQSAKKLLNAKHPGIPRRLWRRLVELSRIDLDKRWQDVNKKELARFKEQILRCPLTVSGKTTFKEEFVTAGGISRTEIDFKDFSIRSHPGLYAVGELTDVDGVTGGFNFQYAWTSGRLAGLSAAH